MNTISISEKMYENPDYNTDTGNAQGGDIFARGQIKLGNQSGIDAITLEDAFNMIEQLPGKPMLLVKTNKHGSKPGAYYAKAFVNRGADYDSLLRVMNENNINNRFKTRKAWVCDSDRKWR